jgi:hypothetical protein
MLLTPTFVGLFLAGTTFSAKIGQYIAHHNRAASADTLIQL